MYWTSFGNPMTTTLTVPKMKCVWGRSFLFPLKTLLYLFLHVYSTKSEKTPMPQLGIVALCGSFFKAHDWAIFSFLLTNSGEQRGRMTRCSLLIATMLFLAPYISRGKYFTFTGRMDVRLPIDINENPFSIRNPPLTRAQIPPKPVLSVNLQPDFLILTSEKFL